MSAGSVLAILRSCSMNSSLDSCRVPGKKFPHFLPKKILIYGSLLLQTDLLENL